MKYVSNGNPALLVWNPETKRFLCQFVDGVFETEEKKAIKILDTIAATKKKDMEGKPVPPRISRADGKKAVASELKQAPTAPEDLSIKQLKEYAKEKGIDIPKKAKGKTAILEIITEAEAGEPVASDDQGDGSDSAD